LARPRAFARYIAVSAFLISSSAVWPSCGNIEMPTDGVTEISRPSAFTGTSIAASSFCVASSTSARCSTPGSSTMNSSPPKRATRSVERRLWMMRCATVCSSVSPIRWPSESLTRLKWSRSMNSSASCESLLRAPVMRCSSVSMKLIRFGSCVSASWWARWWMRSCAASRSRRSRTSVMRMRSPLRSIVRTVNSTGMRPPSLCSATLS